MCSLDLKSTTLEHRIHRVYWNDGTLDLIIGMVIILIGIGWQLGQVALSAVIPGVAVPIWIALRKGIVEPRMGTVVFSGERQGRTRSGLIRVVAAGAIVLLCVVGLILLRQGWSPVSRVEAASPAIPAVLIGIAGVFSGTLFQLWRLTAYGAVAFAIAAAGTLLGIEPPIQIMACGAVPLVAGVVLLSRFLHEFPRVTTPASK